MNIKDQNIIKAIREGRDDAAFEQIYSLMLPKVKNFIRKNSGTQEEALDIFQDGILILYKQVKLNKFNESEEVGGFLFSVCRNLWINKVKRENSMVKMKQEDLPEHSESHIYEGIISEEKTKALNVLLNNVGERCKELLINVTYNKLSMEEICKLMDFPNTNAAKTQHYKCKQKLMKLIQESPETFNLLKG